MTPVLQRLRGSCLHRVLSAPHRHLGGRSYGQTSPAAVDLVVLSDYLVTDPRMLRDLHSQRVPHLPVRVRDGTGLVGPLVIPGATSCLDNSVDRSGPRSPRGGPINAFRESVLLTVRDIGFRPVQSWVGCQ
jgi:hypothetical protein